VDWIAVRKYHEPEPTISYGEEESGSWTIEGITYTKRRKIVVHSDEPISNYQLKLNYSKFSDSHLFIIPLSSISFTEPTPENRTIIYSQQATITINTSSLASPGSNITNITIFIYDYDGSLIEKHICEINAPSGNCSITNTLSSNSFLFNATASISDGTNISTGTRSLFITKGKPYWASPSTNEIWFKANLTTGTDAFYVYYGGSEDLSSPKDVFLFFDDFDGIELNTSAWYEEGDVGDYAIENGALNMWNNWGGCCAGSCV